MTTQLKYRVMLQVLAGEVQVTNYKGQGLMQSKRERKQRRGVEDGGPVPSESGAKRDIWSVHQWSTHVVLCDACMCAFWQKCIFLAFLIVLSSVKGKNHLVLISSTRPSKRRPWRQVHSFGRIFFLKWWNSTIKHTILC